MFLKKVGWICKDYTERYQACHDHCERFLEEKRKWSEVDEKMRKERDYRTYKYGVVLNTIEKERKKKGAMRRR